jgi:hypothetical protein
MPARGRGCLIELRRPRTSRRSVRSTFAVSSRSDTPPTGCDGSGPALLRCQGMRRARFSWRSGSSPLGLSCAPDNGWRAVRRRADSNRVTVFHDVFANARRGPGLGQGSASAVKRASEPYRAPHHSATVAPSVAASPRDECTPHGPFEHGVAPRRAGPKPSRAWSEG